MTYKMPAHLQKCETLSIFIITDFAKKKTMSSLEKEKEKRTIPLKY